LVRRLVDVLLANVRRCVHIIIMLVRGELLLTIVTANLALQLSNALLILVVVGIQALRLAQLIFINSFLLLHLAWSTIHPILWLLLILTDHDLRQHVVVASLFVLTVSSGVGAGLATRVLWRRGDGAWWLQRSPRRRIRSLHRRLRPWATHVLLLWLRLLHELRRHACLHVARMMALVRMHRRRLGVQSVVLAHWWMRWLVAWKKMLTGVWILQRRGGRRLDV